MIDTPMMPTDALKWRAEIERHEKILYIINTHHHIDHTAGNFFFPGTVVSHQGIRESLYGPVKSVMNVKHSEDAVKAGRGPIENIRLLVEEHDPDGLSLLNNYQLRAPTITFTERLTLYVGKHTFELYRHPGHTASHIGVYIPEERVFFAGDNFTNRTQPSLAYCLPFDWVDSLKKIEAMAIDVVVPGHGEICAKSEVREFRLFIEQCIDMVQKALNHGVSREEAAAKISFEKLYPKDQSNLPVHPGAEQQRRNVLQLYDVLTQAG
jgi:cyclase